MRQYYNWLIHCDESLRSSPVKVVLARLRKRASFAFISFNFTQQLRRFEKQQACKKHTAYASKVLLGLIYKSSVLYDVGVYAKCALNDDKIREVFVINHNLVLSDPIIQNTYST